MTDRTLRTPDDLDSLDFEKADGLVPVVVQDVTDDGVLMVAWANRQALEASLSSGTMHFWSRSREDLWMKGATSGNTLSLISLHADCDADTVLARVDATGPACHTGDRTCFGEGAAAPIAEPPTPRPLDLLAEKLAERAKTAPEGSYTLRLLEDRNLRFKKLGEEVVELVVALADGEADRATEEAADMVYHTLVALQAAGVTLADVEAELERRAR